MTMNPVLKMPDTSGREHYRALYRHDLEKQAEWHRRGATNKADSISMLLRQQSVRPHRMVELGCGTGAVIEECRRRQLASEFVAVDYAEEAVRHLSSRAADIEVMAADITSDDFSIAGRVDVVVLSHVLEHLEQPEAFLDAVVRRVDFDWLIAEVPLEDLPASRVKALVRDRLRNRAGHVQFFRGKTFRNLLAARGLELVGERRYVPVMDTETIEFVCAKNNESRLRRLQKLATGRWLPTLLTVPWTRLYYAHLAVLCRKSRPEHAISTGIGQ
jgi:trans-aconitate methyltransferase